MSVSVYFFRPQPKDDQFTVTEEERNLKILTFRRLESENLDFIVFKKVKNYLNIKIVCGYFCCGFAFVWVCTALINSVKCCIKDASQEVRKAVCS